VRWTVFKSQFCGFAAQKYSTKLRLKNCRLARRYVGQEIYFLPLRKYRKSKGVKAENLKFFLFGSQFVG
jgi:hypothetical protein